MEMFLIAIAIMGFFYLILKPFRSYTETHLSGGLSFKAKTLLALNRTQYHDWLCKYNPYYLSLTEKLREKFLFRVAAFRITKKFKFHAIPEDELMVVLISGAAVQITFGLRNFLMDYFPVIHVIEKEYELEFDKEMYYGHVSRSGIYISCKHFLLGFEDYTDCENMGLHEMAHALTYDVFLGNQDHFDYIFKKKLSGFKKEALPVFRLMRQQPNTLLDQYGASNFDEFWAVCIEAFFENPKEFESSMPALFNAMCVLLNQNPLNSDKIINVRQGGLAF